MDSSLARLRRGSARLGSTHKQRQRLSRGLKQQQASWDSVRPPRAAGLTASRVSTPELTFIGGGRGEEDEDEGAEEEGTKNGLEEETLCRNGGKVRATGAMRVCRATQ